MSFHDERERREAHTDAARCARLEQRGTADWIETECDDLLLAVADASGLAPPDGALNWHGFLGRFPFGPRGGSA